MTRVAVIRDPTITSGVGQLAAIQAVAPSFGVELSPVGVRDADEIERAITAFAHASNGGLIVTGGPLTVLSSASPDRAASSRGSIFSRLSWWRSG